MITMLLLFLVLPIVCLAWYVTVSMIADGELYIGDLCCYIALAFIPVSNVILACFGLYFLVNKYYYKRIL